MGKIIDFVKKALRSRRIYPDKCNVQHDLERSLDIIASGESFVFDGPDCVAAFYRKLLEAGYIDKHNYKATISNLESFLPPPTLTITHKGEKFALQHDREYGSDQ